MARGKDGAQTGNALRLEERTALVRRAGDKENELAVAGVDGVGKLAGG